MYWRREQNALHETRWQEARHATIHHRLLTWHANRILIFLEPEKYYSCFLLWDHQLDTFNCYYINFQLPFRWSHFGFDSLDLDLDIVVDHDYHWNWKDEDEYRDGINEGGIRDVWVEDIDRSKAEVFRRINTHSYPLDGSWLQWQPDRTWSPPNLPDKWQVA